MCLVATLVDSAILEPYIQKRRSVQMYGLCMPVTGFVPAACSMHQTLK